MLDVHPPHHPPSTWKDFLLHIATISIGLLIALALEGAVEALHHRHIVREARENIRRELQQNAANAQKDLQYLVENEKNMETNIDRIRTLRSNPRALDHGHMSFSFTWEGFNQSAWLSARDSGALTYMPSDEVQRDADIYVQQEIVDRQAIDIFTHQSDAAAPLIMEPDAGVLTPAETNQLLQGTAITILRIKTLNELTQGLNKQFADRLKQD